MSKPHPSNHPHPYGCFDASHWADEFMNLIVKRGIEVDHALMIGWFANAIMTGYDYAHQQNRESNTRLAKLKETYKWLKAKEKKK